MKKLICLMLAAIMIFALAACDFVDIDQYKATAQESLDAYVVEKDASDYTAENWARLSECVQAGKTAIDEATSKQDVDKALSDAQNDIDDIPIIAFDMVEFVNWESSKVATNNRIKLNNIRDDVIYECSVDEGELIYGEEKGKTLTVNPGETIQWFPTKFGDFDAEEYAFMELRMKSGEEVVGYALIEIYRIDFYYEDGNPQSHFGAATVELSYQPVRLVTDARAKESKSGFGQEYINGKFNEAKNYVPQLTYEMQAIKETVEQETYGFYLKYYGGYNGSEVFLCVSADLAISYKSISGVRFGWGDLRYFLIWRNGTIYSLDEQEEEIFGNGILTQRDIEKMGGLYGRMHNLQRGEW